MPRKAAAATAEKPKPIDAVLEPMDSAVPSNKAPTVIDRSDPHAAVYIATERGADPTLIRELIAAAREHDALIEERRAREAKRAFIRAMTTFKEDPPVVKKSKTVDYTPANKGRVFYKYADLAVVVAAVAPSMAKVNLSHYWEIDQKDSITVTCVLQHVDGHETRTTLFGSADDSGGKNKIQGVGSTVNYLQRYTLLSALGLATEGEDNDGRGAGETERPAEAQAKVDEFMDKLDACASVGELGKVRMDAIKHYTSSSMLPKEFVSKYSGLRTEFERKERGP